MSEAERTPGIDPDEIAKEAQRNLDAKAFDFSADRPKPATMHCSKCGEDKGKAGWPPKAWKDQNPRGYCRLCISKASKVYFANKKKREGMKVKPPENLADLTQMLSGGANPIEVMLTKLIESQERIMLELVKKL